MLIRLPKQQTIYPVVSQRRVVCVLTLTTLSRLEYFGGEKRKKERNEFCLLFEEFRVIYLCTRRHKNHDSFRFQGETFADFEHNSICVGYRKRRSKLLSPVFQIEMTLGDSFEFQKQYEMKTQSTWTFYISLDLWIFSKACALQLFEIRIVLSSKNCSTAHLFPSFHLHFSPS